jgi:hypothetical protein
VIAALAWRVLSSLVGFFRRRRRDGQGLPGMPRCNASNPAYTWIACSRVDGHSGDHQTVITWMRDADEG